MKTMQATEWRIENDELILIADDSSEMRIACPPEMFDAVAKAILLGMAMRGEPAPKGFNG